MCLNPIPIQNKNRAYIKGDIELNNSWIFQHLRDNTSQYMYVPCGVCKECIFTAQMDLVQRVQMESLNNRIFMGTTTYKEEQLPRIELPPYEDKQGYLHEGYQYRYARYEDASEAIKRMRGNNVFGIPFKYLIVSERGSKRSRPHFHWLFLFKKSDLPTYNDCITFEKEFKWTLFENWKRNIGTRNNPLYQELSEYKESYRHGRLRSTYDFHYVNPILTKGGVTDVAFYVLKYMLKGMQEEKAREAIKINYDESQAYRFWNIVRNRREYSLGFGLDIDLSKQGKNRTITEDICNPEIVKYLKDGIQRSLKAKEPYAFYYCPENLLTFPLSGYYRKKKFIYDNDRDFWALNPKEYEANMLYPERKSYQEIKQQMYEFEKVLQKTELEDISNTFDELL